METESLYNRCYLVEYDEGDMAIYRTPINYRRNSFDKYHVVRQGDTLHLIAQKYYRSQYAWFIIAEVNADVIPDIFSLTVGTSLVIPDLNAISALYGRS